MIHIIGFIADLICKWFPDERPESHYRTIETYKKIPKPGEVKIYNLNDFGKQ